MKIPQFYLGVLICSVVPFLRITEAVSSTTQASSTRAPSDTLPTCDFDIPLDPKLVCKMFVPEAEHYYSENQKFCACPAYSECINREVEHKITMEMELVFVCYKKPAYADKAHGDSTMGLLREEAY